PVIIPAILQQFTPSSNPRTATKQKQRFERSVRRVLKDENINPGGTSSTSTKLAAARKRKFLFLDSQKLRPLAPNSSFSPSPYCPIPDMPFPPQYWDIIPPDPIYDKNDNFIVPGSHEWFSYMHNLSKIHIANNRKAETTQLTIDQKAKARDKRLQELATNSGTTPKHMNNRWRVVDNLTTYNNTYNRIMTVHRNSALHDTKEVKMRPLKRDIYVSSSVDDARNMSKRIRTDPTLASDSKQA
ncbi:467_t:CDS:2, partial [Rhizophagus irregularis]